MNQVQKTAFAGRQIEPFVQVIDFASIAAGAVSPGGTFTVQADADFIWTAGAYMADIAGAAQTDSSRVIPLLTATLNNGTTNRQLSNQGVGIPLGALFGGREPLPLVKPLLITSNSVFTVTLANYSNATAYLCRLAFIGYKVFK